MHAISKREYAQSQTDENIAEFDEMWNLHIHIYNVVSLASNRMRPEIRTAVDCKNDLELKYIRALGRCATTRDKAAQTFLGKQDYPAARVLYEQVLREIEQLPELKN